MARGCFWSSSRSDQAVAESARMRVSASMNAVCQGKRAGRCIVQRLAIRVRRPGSANSRRRSVRAVLGVGFGEAEQISPASEVVREASDDRAGTSGEFRLAAVPPRRSVTAEHSPTGPGRSRRRKSNCRPVDPRSPSPAVSRAIPSLGHSVPARRLIIRMSVGRLRASRPIDCFEDAPIEPALSASVSGRSRRGSQIQCGPVRGKCSEWARTCA